MDDPKIEREVDLPGTPDDVWTALTDEIGEWFGADGDVDPTRGGRARFRWRDGTRREAVVEEAVPAERLRLRWLPVEWGPIGDPRVAPASTVTFEIEPIEDGSRLRVVEELCITDPRELPVHRFETPRRSMGFEARALVG